MAKNKKIKTAIYSYREEYEAYCSLNLFNTFASNTAPEPKEYEQEAASKNPEQLLFLAVIYQALLDAMKERQKNDSEEVNRSRQEAKKWFTVSSGTTATDFEEVCLLAGVEPNVTRSFAKKIINKEIAFDRKRINVLINSNDDDDDNYEGEDT